MRRLVAHPRFHLHFTPTGAPWLNMVERVVRRADPEEAQAWRPPLRPGTRTRHPSLARRLERAPQTFIWTRTADEILDKVAACCQRLTDSGH
ncbi:MULTISPECIES: hypothetical protein [Streptomyces]|uniref:hypothetical protein n=1 Tax=Streptomyces TaxID=1883 RepID=UPI0033169B74